MSLDTGSGMTASLVERSCGTAPHPLQWNCNESLLILTPQILTYYNIRLFTYMSQAFFYLFSYDIMTYSHPLKLLVCLFYCSFLKSLILMATIILVVLYIKNFVITILILYHFPLFHHFTPQHPIMSMSY